MSAAILDILFFTINKNYIFGMLKGRKQMR